MTRRVKTGAELRGMRVIAVRYRGSRSLSPVGDERCLDAYAETRVYAAAGIPYDVFEPRFPEAMRSEDEEINLGLLGGEIAEGAAEGLRAGECVLMVGGNCTHATGILGGLQLAHGAGARIGLVWMDAHGDFNTPKTTLTGSYGGMPVAVSAGLGCHAWRERSQILAPLPTERILLVGVRNLDAAEEKLIEATEVRTAAPSGRFQGHDLGRSAEWLASRCDLLYLHIDADILDASYVPNHGTREPDGPNMGEVGDAIERVMATGKVAALAVVSVYGGGEGRARSLSSGSELIRRGLRSWRQHGMAAGRRED